MPANKMPEMPEAVAWMHRGDLETMKEFPDAVLYAIGRDLGGQHDPLYTADQMRAMYLAGIEAARACVPAELACLDFYDQWEAGHNRCREETLTNLTALEQEAKK